MDERFIVKSSDGKSNVIKVTSAGIDFNDESGNNLMHIDTINDEISCGRLETETITSKHITSDDFMARNDVFCTNLATSGSVRISQELFVSEQVHLKSDLDISGGLIKNLGMPKNSNDAVTKEYVDSAIQGFKSTMSVTAATTKPIDIFSSTEKVDDVALSSNDLVLIKDQVKPSENGVYTFANGLQKLQDLHYSSLYVFVENGSKNSGTSWTSNSTNITTPHFVQFATAGHLIAGAGLTKNGNVMNVNTSPDLEVSGDSLRISTNALGTGLSGGSGTPIYINENLPHITGLGNITSGKWNADVISTTHGGSGQKFLDHERVLLGNGEEPIDFTSNLTFSHEKNSLVTSRIRTHPSLTGKPDSFGQYLTLPDSTFSDNSTPETSLTAFWSSAYFGSPTITATNVGVSITDAATLCISDSPVSGINVTVQNTYAMLVKSGKVCLNDTTDAHSLDSGSLIVKGGSSTSGNVFIKGGINTTTKGKLVLSDGKRGILQGNSTNNSLYLGSNFAGTHNVSSLYASEQIELYTGGEIGVQALRLSISESGQIDVTNTTDTSFTSQGGMQIGGNVKCKGNFSADSVVSRSLRTLHTDTLLTSIYARNAEIFFDGHYDDSGELKFSRKTVYSISKKAGELYFSGSTDAKSPLEKVLSMTTSGIVVHPRTNSSSTESGSLVVKGGLGISGDLSIGGTFRMAGQIESTDTKTGTLVVDGGFGVSQRGYFGEGVYLPFKENVSQLNFGFQNGEYPLTMNVDRSGTFSLNNWSSKGTVNLTSTNSMNLVVGTHLAITSGTGVSIDKRLNLASNLKGTLRKGQFLNVTESLVTDTVTDNFDVIPEWSGTQFSASTLSSQNTGVKTLTASTVCISGAPTATGNMSIGKSYALKVTNGDTLLENLTVSGNLVIGGTLNLSSLSVAHYSDIKLGGIVVSQDTSTKLSTQLPLEFSIANSERSIIFNSQQNATSTTSGSVTVIGGVGITGAVHSEGLCVQPKYITDSCVDITNTTIQNLQKGALIKKVYCKDFTGRQISNVLCTTVNVENEHNSAHLFIGYIAPPYAEKFTFHVTCNNRTKIFIGNEKVIDYDKSSVTPIVLTGTITFTQKYYLPIVVSTVSSTLKFEWSSATQVRTVVSGTSFAYSAHEAAPILHGPISVNGTAEFNDEVIVKETLKINKNLVVAGDISLKGTIVSQYYEYSTISNMITYKSTQITKPTVLAILPNSTSGNSSLRIYGEVNDVNLVTNTFFEIGYNESVQSYCISSKSNGAGSLRPIRINMNTVNVISIEKDIKLNTDLDVTGNVNVSRDFRVTGDAIIEGTAAISTLSSQHVYLSGDSPSIAFTDGTGTSTTFALQAHERDHICLDFSMNAPSAFGIHKKNDKLDFVYGLNAKSALHIDSFGNIVMGGGHNSEYTTTSETPVNLFISNTNGENGSIKVSPAIPNSECSIAFYSDNTFSGDFWSLGKNGSAFAIGKNSESVLHIDVYGNVQINTVTESNSVSDGAFTVCGGASFGKNVHVGGGLEVIKNIITPHVKTDTLYSTDVLIEEKLTVRGESELGRLYLYSTLDFKNESTGEPTYTYRSVGTRVVLSDCLSDEATDYAIGLSEKAMWWSIPSADHTFELYAGIHKLLSLDGSGNLLLSAKNGITKLDGSKGLYINAPITFYDNPTSSTWSLGSSVENVFNICDTISIARNSNVTVALDLSVSGNIFAKDVHSNNLKISETLFVNDIYSIDGTINVLSIKEDTVCLNSTNLDLHINCEKDSKTVINKYNYGSVEIFNGIDCVFAVTDTGVQNFGTFTQNGGELYVNVTTDSTNTESGAITTLGGMGLSGNLYVGKNVTLVSTDAQIRLNKSSISVKDETLTLSSKSTIINSCTTSLKGDVVIENSLACRSATLTKGMSLFTGTLNVGWYELSVDGTLDTWYYIGKFNTTGKLQLEVCNGNDNSAPEANGILHFSASVTNGKLYANHRLEGTEKYTQADRSNVMIFSDSEENYSAYIYAKSNSTTLVHVKICTATPLFTDSGQFAAPKEYTEKWTLVYGTNTPSLMQMRTGKLWVDNDLSVSGNVSLNKNLVVPLITTEKFVSSNEKLDFYTSNNLKLSISENVDFAGSIMPCQSDLDIGSKKDRFRDIYLTGNINTTSTDPITINGDLKVHSVVADKLYSGDILLVDCYKGTSEDPFYYTLLNSRGKTAYIADNLELGGSLCISTGKSSQCGTLLCISASENYINKNLEKGAYVDNFSTAYFASNDINTENQNVVIETASTVCIDKAPFSGINTTVHNSFALLVRSGKVNIMDETPAYSTGEAALSIKGGLHVHGIYNAGALQFDKSVGISTKNSTMYLNSAKDFSFSNEDSELLCITSSATAITTNVHVNSFTVSTSATTGALVVSGGVGISGILNVASGISLGINSLSTSIANDLLITSGAGNIVLRPCGMESAQIKATPSEILLGKYFTTETQSGITTVSSLVVDNTLNASHVHISGTFTAKSFTLQNWSISADNVDLLYKSGSQHVCSMNAETGKVVFYSTNDSVSDSALAVAGSISIAKNVYTHGQFVNSQTVQSQLVGFSIENKSSSSAAYTETFVYNDTNSGLVTTLNSSKRTEDGGQSTATIRNNVGKLRLQGSGKLGLCIAETTGNATFDGLLRVNSGLESTSTKSGALIVSGGGAFDGNIHVKNALVLGESVSLGAHSTSNIYNLVLPKDLPAEKSHLTCDVDGNLSWSKTESEVSLLQKNVQQSEPQSEHKGPVQNTSYLVITGETAEANAKSLHVLKGKTVLSETTDSLITGGNVKIGRNLHVLGNLEIRGSSKVNCILHGSTVVGASGSHVVSIEVNFGKELYDTEYRIVGNVVSRGNNSDIFTCCFKNLTKSGCTVSVIRLDTPAAWSDATVRVDYQVMY